MFGEIGFTQTQAGVFIDGAFQRDIRRDALGLDRAAVGRVITRGGELDRGVVAQRQYGLHRTFAERLLAHDHRTPVILQRTGDNLRS